MEKKYELIDATAEGAYANKGKVYRIRALRDIDIVNRGGAYKFRAGDLGGLISGEHNLSQEGDCWIDSTSVVFENARIEGDALVLKSSKVTSNATVKGNAPVISSVITDSAVVEDICVSNCAIYNNAKATGNVFLLACKLADNSEIAIRDGANMVMHAVCLNKDISLKSMFDYVYMYPIWVPEYDTNKGFGLVITHSNVVCMYNSEFAESATNYVGINYHVEHAYKDMLDSIRARINMKAAFK